jgi:hypothetical protein
VLQNSDSTAKAVLETDGLDTDGQINGLVTNDLFDCATFCMGVKLGLSL